MKTPNPTISFLKEPEPRVVLLLDNPRFTILEANQHYLKATNSNYSDLIGKGIFEAFPENPDNIAPDGYQKLRSALEGVIQTRQLQIVPPVRYDLPVRATTGFKVRYWNTVCSPSFDENNNLEFIFVSVKDITESELSEYFLRNLEIEKAKEKELREQAEILAKIGAWEFNLANSKIHWSDGVFRICEFEPQEFEVTIEKRMEIIHPDDREKAKEFWYEILDTGKECRVEIRYITKNKTIKYITSIGKTIMDSYGKPYKIFGVDQDVTDIKLAEEKAQRRTVFIETALENLPIGIAVNNIDDNKVVFVNTQFTEIYGWPLNVLNNIHSFYKKIYPNKTYRDEITKRISDDIKSGDINRMNWNEIIITTQNGEKKIVTAKNIPLYSQNLMISTVVDITDKIASRNTILQSNERYEYVTKATFDAIWDWDINGDTIYWGEGFEKIFGYQLSLLKTKSTELTDYVHPDDYQKVMDSIRNAIISSEINWFEEYRFKKGDGDYAYVINKGIIIRDSKGYAVRMIGALQDITTKKREEERLKLLESVITNTNDAILITEAEPVDEPGPRIVYVNEAFTKMTGYTVEEVIGKTPRILQGPKSDKEELKRLSKALRNWETCEITTINYKKSGEEFCVNFTVTPVADKSGWFTHWISIERDVTERKKNEEKLIAANQQTTNTLESIQDGFYALDKEWIITYWNNEAERIIGRKREDVIGKNLWKIFQKNSSRKTAKEFNLALETQKPVRFVEFYRYIDRWFDISAYPSEHGLTVYFKDIDDRKKAELKLVAINEELKAHAKELAISNEELEQFAYVASHDLQEPLRMVTSFLSQLEKKYSDVLDEKGRKYIYFAIDGAKRMRQIILDLLEFSKVGKSEENLELVNLNQVIEEVQLLYRKKIEEKEAFITHGLLPTITFFRSPISQIMQNLISNALKYSRDDEKPLISIKACENKTFWQFEVKDNGIGIDKEYFDKIFIIFQSLHNKDEYSGTGMGLAITKKIIENMGGQIWLKSEEGKGTTFYFTLPKIKNTNL